MEIVRGVRLRVSLQRRELSRGWMPQSARSTGSLCTYGFFCPLLSFRGIEFFRAFAFCVTQTWAGATDLFVVFNRPYKMNQMTIGNRIYVLAGFLTCVIVAISVFAVLRVNRLSATSETISGNSMPRLANMGNVTRGMAEAQLRVFRILHSPTPEQRKVIRDEIGEMARNIASELSAYEKGITTEDERRLFATFLLRREEFLKVRGQLLDLVEKDLLAAEAFRVATVAPAYNRFFETRRGDFDLYA